MKSIILAYSAAVVGILLADISILVDFFNQNGLEFLNEKKFTLPVFFLFILLAIKNIYEISLYTDETIPLKLSILGLILAIIGLLVFFRVLILGMVALVVGAYWSRAIVRSYYPRIRSQ